MRSVSSSPEHRGRDQQRRHACHRGQGRHAALRRHGDPQVGTHHESHVTCHECHVSCVRPTITWRREDGENIRLCDHRYGELSDTADDCREVGISTGWTKKKCVLKKTKIGHTFFWSTLYISTLYLHIYVKSTYLLTRWRPTRGTA